MAGLDPATHAVAAKQASHASHANAPEQRGIQPNRSCIPDVGGRVKPGHDVRWNVRGI